MSIKLKPVRGFLFAGKYMLDSTGSPVIDEDTSDSVSMTDAVKLMKYDMTDEFDRLRTFDDHHFYFDVSVAELARNGFYCIREYDKVRCHFCGLHMEAFVYGDLPPFEHYRWSPNCPLFDRETNNRIIGPPALFDHDIASVRKKLSMREYLTSKGFIPSTTYFFDGTPEVELCLGQIRSSTKYLLGRINADSAAIFTAYMRRYFGFRPQNLDDTPVSIVIAGHFVHLGNVDLYQRAEIIQYALNYFKIQIV